MGFSAWPRCCGLAYPTAPFRQSAAPITRRNRDNRLARVLGVAPVPYLELERRAEFSRKSVGDRD